MKKLFIFIFCFILILPYTSILCLAEDEPRFVTTENGFYDIDALEYETEIALLVNADTDTVVYSKNADQITAPASLVKITTALVSLSMCNDLQTEIVCSEEAINSLLGTGSSVANLMAGEKTTFEMLLYCLFLPSANDAAAVLAEHFGEGDTSAFVKKMNEYVTKLGCKNTYFANPHGLDDTTIEGFDSDTQNRTTANDMYLIAKHALNNEIIKKISSKYGKTMPATNMSSERYLYNTNGLLNDCSYYYYEGAIGLKTGTTNKAGSCLISSATKNGYTYIAIAMKGNTDYYDAGENRNTAFITCRYMLNWAFENMKVKVLADKSYNLGEVAVNYGRGLDYVALVPSENITAVVHNDITIDDMTIEFPENFISQVEAPVKKGDVVGTAKIMYEGVCVAEVSLVAQQDVKKNHLWAAFDWTKELVTSKEFLITILIIVLLIVLIVLGTKNSRRRRKRRKSRIDIVKDYSNLAK